MSVCLLLRNQWPQPNGKNKILSHYENYSILKLGDINEKDIDSGQSNQKWMAHTWQLFSITRGSILSIYWSKVRNNCFKLHCELHLSCLAASFSPGDEVIVPAQTHVATAHAVEYTGAKPIFIDVDPITET